MTAAAAVPVLSWWRLVLREAEGWPEALRRLGILVALFLVLFHADLADLVHVWLTSAPYGHCVFIPLIIAFMVWQRRAGLAQLEPHGWWPALAWIGLGALVWLLGSAAGVALFRHAALVIMAQGLVLMVLGPAIGRALAFPLFYALFLIPVGTEAEPALQILTARMAVELLWLAGVPAEISGIFIATPAGLFRVAEACSGAGFLLAMAAFATLVAHLCFRTLVRRLLFVASALAVCLLANGVRTFGIIFLANQTSLDAAVVVDHVVYGWLFFALVIALVILLGWRFFDRSPLDRWFDPARLQGAVERPRGVGLGLLLAAAIVMVAPVSWSASSQAFSTSLPAVTPLPQVAGWQPEGAPLRPVWQPHFTGADRMVIGHYRDPAGRVADLAIVLFASQEEGKELVGFGQGAAAPQGQGPWLWAAPANAPPSARGDLLAGPGGQQRLAYSFYHVGGVLTGQAGRVKLETLRARLMGGDQRALAIIVSTEVPPGQGGQARAAQALADFLQALGPVEDLADRSLAIR